MTTYRLMDGVAGRPGIGSSGTQPPAAGVGSGLGNYIAGVMFDVTQGGLWFQGYYWYCAASAQDTAPAGGFKCALWQLSTSSTGVIVPGSTATASSVTAGQWNFIPLTTPILLAPCGSNSYGAVYLAAIGYVVSAGFPDTTHQFGSANPYSAGITNGPLVAPSSSGGSAPAGSAFSWTKPQCPFSTASADPTVVMPGSNNLDDILWLDVLVSDQAPANAGYKSFGAAPVFVSPGTSAQALAYTLGLEFTVSQPCTLAKIWHYSPPSATVLPTDSLIWVVQGQTILSGSHLTSVTWKKQADGTTASAGAGWVYSDYTGLNIQLAAGTHYKASTFTADNVDPWFLAFTGWWGASPGPFSSGVTAGPLTVLGNGASTQGQDSWNQGITLTYPATGNISSGGTESPEFDGVDVEVTANPPAPSNPPFAYVTRRM